MTFLAQDGGVAGALFGPLGVVVAFFVGMVSFFSPCVLPLLPGYLTYVSGLSGEEVEAGAARRRVLAGTTLFALGFATVFTALGAIASTVGEVLNRNLLAINRVAGSLVILLGLAFVVPRLFPFLDREARPLMRRVRPGVAGAYPLGVAFAVGWTPCVGPGYAAILALSAGQATVLRGTFLTFSFSLGFGLWFVLAGLGARRALHASSWIRRHARALQLVGGVFMVTIGVLLVTDRWLDVIGPLRDWANRFTLPI